MIIGGVATQIGNASQDGEIRVSITEDPIITLANVSISNSASNSNSPSLEALRAAREAAIQAARREILKSIKDGKPITTKQLNAAEIYGGTEKNVSLINSDISKLSDSSKEEISAIEKIVFKYLTIDRVARGERVNFRDLQSLGLISEKSNHKSSITIALRKAASIQVDTFDKIESFVSAVEKKFSDRKAALLAQIARIQALLGR
jgi:cellobiose-specific phosphotransferase system component IIA